MLAKPGPSLYHSTTVLCDRDAWLASIMHVLKEIPISLWCTGLPVCRYGQKVTLVKKWVSYMPGKGVKLKIGFFSILFWFKACSYLTNHGTDKHET